MTTTKEALRPLIEEIESKDTVCLVCQGKGYVESVMHVTPCMTCGEVGRVIQDEPTLAGLKARLAQMEEGE